MIKRPMLACSQNVTPDGLQSLQYPIYATPKLDGIRCLIVNVNGVPTAMSRAMKPIPNALIQYWVQQQALPEGLDGELIIPGATFHQIQSKVMTEFSPPFKFTYWVFDRWDLPENGYKHRVKSLTALHYRLDFSILHPEGLWNKDEVIWAEESYLKEGYEGVILRSIDGPYKQGRSTWKEGYMLKMKRFTDCEGIIVGFEERMKNNNPPRKDERGYTKRSSHQNNLSPSGTLGRIFLKGEDGKVVTIGSGWDAALAQEIWNNQPKYLGKTATYKKQTHGEKDAPRIATFKGIRYD